MIYASLPHCGVATTGGDDADMPSAREIAAHVDFVRRTCDHPALCLNGSLELITCPRCAPDGTARSANA